MSMTNQTKSQFMERCASYSTRASKRGFNLLGWDLDEYENMTLIQKREALIAATRNLEERRKYLKKGSDQWVEDGKMIHAIHLELASFKNGSGKDKSRDLSFWIVDVVKEECSADRWGRLVAEALRRKHEAENAR